MLHFSRIRCTENNFDGNSHLIERTEEGKGKNSIVVK